MLVNFKCILYFKLGIALYFHYHFKRFMETSGGAHTSESKVNILSTKVHSTLFRRCTTTTHVLLHCIYCTHMNSSHCVPNSCERTQLNAALRRDYFTSHGWRTVSGFAASIHTTTPPLFWRHRRMYAVMGFKATRSSGALWVLVLEARTAAVVVRRRCAPQKWVMPCTACYQANRSNHAAATQYMFYQLVNERLQLQLCCVSTRATRASRLCIYSSIWGGRRSRGKPRATRFTHGAHIIINTYWVELYIVYILTCFYVLHQACITCDWRASLRM